MWLIVQYQTQRGICADFQRSLRLLPPFWGPAVFRFLSFSNSCVRGLHLTGLPCTAWAPLLCIPRPRKLVQLWGSAHLFPSVRESCAASCPVSKRCCLICFIHFSSCWRGHGRINLDPVTPSCLENEVPWMSIIGGIESLMIGFFKSLGMYMSKKHLSVCCLVQPLFCADYKKKVNIFPLKRYIHNIY